MKKSKGNTFYVNVVGDVSVLEVINCLRLESKNRKYLNPKHVNRGVYRFDDVETGTYRVIYDGKIVDNSVDGITISDPFEFTRENSMNEILWRKRYVTT